MKNLKVLKLIAFILIVICFSSCKVTTPMLSYSGANYNSITDDILLYNCSGQVIHELSLAVTSQKVLVVQTVNSPSSDMLAEKIYETLSSQGKMVGLAKRSDLSTINVEMFDKILFFYPTIYGIETAATRPSKTAEMVYFIPVIGQFVGPSVMKANTYDTRLGAVSLHARLVDSKTGKIEWMKVFQGRDQKKISGGNILDILLPF